MHIPTSPPHSTGQILLQNPKVVFLIGGPLLRAHDSCVVRVAYTVELKPIKQNKRNIECSERFDQKASACDAQME